MKVVFYAVVGFLKNEKKWVQSVHLDYEEAYTQYMANGMSGIANYVDWKIETYEGILVEKECMKTHVSDIKTCPFCKIQELESENRRLKEEVSQQRHHWKRYLDK